WVGVYPFDGQEDVSIAMASDSTGTALGAVRGQPITVAVDPHEKLVLSTITLRHVASGQMLALRVVQDDDHIVHAVPQTFLAQNAEYSLRIVGNVGELRIDRTASFTTGARSGSAAFAPTSTPRTVRSV